MFLPKNSIPSAKNSLKCKNLREFFSLFFDKNSYFRHKLALESGRKLNFCWGPPIINSRKIINPGFDISKARIPVSGRVLTLSPDF